jgi:hypothetical protein
MRRRRACVRKASPQSRPFDGGSGSGRPNGAITAFWVWRGSPAEGQLRTTRKDIAEFFQALNTA